MLKLETTLRKSWLIAVPFAAFSLSSGIAFAQSFGEPTIYKATIHKLELSSDSGSTWSTTIGTKTQEFDIASAGVSSDVGSYLSGTPALTPNTTYNAVRVTVSSTFKMKGSVDDTSAIGTTFYTTAAGGASRDQNDLAEGSYTITECNNLPSGTNSVSGGQCLDERTASLKTDGQGNMTFTVCFDISEGLELDGSDLVPGNPTITYTSGTC